MKKSRMGIHPQWLPSVVVGLMALGALLVVGWWGRDLPGPKRGLLYVALGFAACLVLGGMAVSPIRVAALFPRGIVVWVRAAAVVAAAWALAAFVLTAAWRRVAIERFDPGRRALLRVARNATYLAPAAVTGFAIVKRHELRLVERDVSIRGLHKDLDGLRLAQISDIHLSEFVPARELARAVAMAMKSGRTSCW